MYTDCDIINAINTAKKVGYAEGYAKGLAEGLAESLGSPDKPRGLGI